MDGLFKAISINKLIRYGYVGFLILFIAYKNEIEPFGKLVKPDVNPVLILFFTFTFGTTFYVFYRYTIGECLYKFTNCIHYCFCKKTSTLRYLKTLVNNGTPREAYNYIRESFFIEKEKENLDFFHTEIYLLYVTSFIGFVYWLCLSMHIGGIYFTFRIGTLGIGILTLISYSTSIYVDIRQHKKERKILELSEFKLKLFLKDYKFIV